MTKSNISCCYYPTTVVFIDDSQSFLDNILLGLDENISARSFNDPVRAVKYLETAALVPFTNKYLRSFSDVENIDWAGYSNVEHSYVDIDLFNIHKEIYNQKRFDAVTVVVVDYAMPGMSGLELCRALKDHQFKFVLMTGETTLDNAIDAFNEGLIHHFILKNHQDFNVKLQKVIDELQEKRFEEFSEVIIKNLTATKQVSLSDPLVIDFIKTFFKKNSVVEYYLANESGSFLLVDFKGNLSWLDIKSEEEMTEYTSTAVDNYASADVVERLQSRKEMLVLYTENDHINVTVDDWGKHFYPATKLAGKNGDYYYSHIKEMVYDGISANTIVSHEKFLSEC